MLNHISNICKLVDLEAKIYKCYHNSMIQFNVLDIESYFTLLTFIVLWHNCQ